MREKNSNNFFATCDALARLGIKISKGAAIVFTLATIVVAGASLAADNRARKEQRAKINRINERFNK